MPRSSTPGPSLRPGLQRPRPQPLGSAHRAPSPVQRNPSRGTQPLFTHDSHPTPCPASQSPPLPRHPTPPLTVFGTPTCSKPTSTTRNVSDTWALAPTFIGSARCAGLPQMAHACALGEDRSLTAPPKDTWRSLGAVFGTWTPCCWRFRRTGRFPVPLALPDCPFHLSVFGEDSLSPLL